MEKRREVFIATTWPRSVVWMLRRQIGKFYPGEMDEVTFMVTALLAEIVPFE